MAIIKCPECGHDVSDSALVCPGCGVNIAGNVIVCPDCGKALLKSYKNCPNCGWPVSEEEGITPKTENKEPVVPKKPSSKNTVLWVIIIVLVILAGFGTYYYTSASGDAAQEQQAYEDLENDTNAADYQAFLDKYPNSEHKQDVTERMQKLQKENNDWLAISMSSSKSDFVNFMSQYPSSPYENNCKTKIDSLDWIEASTQNTPEAYERYLSEHPDGKYIDQANTGKTSIDKTKITPEEKNSVRSLFTSYFESLSSQDETGICSTLNAVIDNFLNKHNATKSDVMAYMKKIFQTDINSMKFNLNNDYKISKTETAPDEYDYTVKFTVDQRIDRTDATKEKFATYAVSAKVNSSWKITELTMRKVSSSN